MKKIVTSIYSFINIVLMRLSGVELGSNLTGLGIIYIKNNGVCKIGSKFSFNSGKFFNPIGGDIVSRIIVKKGAKLTIGKNVGISNTTLFCTKSISIGDNVLIGGGCRIWDTDFHSLDSINRNYQDDSSVVSKIVEIEDGAFIGAGCIILKGVRIGKNSIVGAGSVVSKNVPDEQIWGGNPARFLRQVDKI
jgi:acetyltransferase-like isoleucine patch superfamily enzyme